MKDVNKMILIGRLGADPITRTTKSGIQVGHFSVATTAVRIREELEGNPTRIEETQWHNIVVWGKLAEHCSQYLKKGSSVYIEGVVKSHKYEGKDGTVRTSFEVHAEEVSFLSRPRLDRVEPEESVEPIAEAV